MLGERLRSLREEGVLVIGSGAMTHRFTVFPRRGPGIEVAHATPDRFVPLLRIVAASTTTGRSASTGVGGTRFGNSIRSLQVV